MKKILPALILAGYLLTPGLVFAQQEPPQIIETPEDLINLIERIGNWIFTALLAVAVVFLIMAGFYFVTAGGDPESVNKARRMVISALIGVAIALLARGLVAVIGALLGA